MCTRGPTVRRPPEQEWLYRWWQLSSKTPSGGVSSTALHCVRGAALANNEGLPMMAGVAGGLASDPFAAISDVFIIGSNIQLREPATEAFNLQAEVIHNWLQSGLGVYPSSSWPATQGKREITTGLCNCCFQVIHKWLQSGLGVYPCSSCPATQVKREITTGLCNCCFQVIVTSHKWLQSGLGVYPSSSCPATHTKREITTGLCNCGL
ncbi:uncharacterized protein LOC134075083 isoform X2 [Sardina pilchardus]|uniref:uncharacterized protein LOC134075083 isoform X2 n=1 Tax=Sardina pilchardus TaxID=27697 RepID=UPI002E117FF0